LEQKKRYFTVAEANAFLPTLVPLLQQLQDLKREAQAKIYQLEEAKVLSPQRPDAFFQEEAQIEFLVFHADTLLRQVLETGVQVKDVDTGLCDFPALMHGQDVLLCWRLGEAQVSHWHGLYEGYLGRKEIWDDVDFEHE